MKWSEVLAWTRVGICMEKNMEEKKIPEALVSNVAQSGFAELVFPFPRFPSSTAYSDQQQQNGSYSSRRFSRGNHWLLPKWVSLVNQN